MAATVATTVDDEFVLASFVTLPPTPTPPTLSVDGGREAVRGGDSGATFVISTAIEFVGLGPERWGVREKKQELGSGPVGTDARVPQDIGPS